MDKISPTEARKLSQTSESFFNSQMNEVYAAIRTAAANGKFQIPFPHITERDMRLRVTEQLAIEGYTVVTPSDHVFPVIKW